MKTLIEAAKYIGFPVTPLSVKELANSMNLSSPISVHQLIICASYPMDKAIRDKWAEFGFEKSKLGYPTTETLSIADGSRWVHYNDFENGSIYLTEKYGAHVVLNPINLKLKQILKTAHDYGFRTYCPVPIDDTTTSVGNGLFNNFHNNYTSESIYSTPSTQVPKDIDFWCAIYWSEDTGAYFIKNGHILAEWINNQKGAEGPLGYPISDTQNYSLDYFVGSSKHFESSEYVKFQHGYISYYTDWNSSDLRENSLNLVKKIYVTFGNDPFPPEYYKVPAAGTQTVTPVTPEGQSNWSLRLMIGPVNLYLPDYPSIIWRITEATMKITPRWNASLGRTINGSFTSGPTMDAIFSIPAPPPNEPYNQLVHCDLSFRFTANGQIGDGYVKSPGSIAWTGKNIKASWHAYPMIFYDADGNPIPIVEAQWRGGEPE